MTDDSILSEQRDRFLAFAFASADLLIEVSEEEKIVFALGASRGLTGIDAKSLKGRKWLELFSPYEQVAIQHKMESAKPGGRVGPLIVTLSEAMKGKSAILSGIKMPGKNAYYVAFTLSNAVMDRLAYRLNGPESVEIQDEDGFAETAKEGLLHARAMGYKADITFFDLDLTPEEKERLGEGVLENIRTGLENLLLANSINGRTAGVLGEGRYGVVHDKTVGAQDLLKAAMEIARTSDPQGEGLKIRIKTVESDLHKLNDRELVRSLLYTLGEFRAKGLVLDVVSLNTALEARSSQNIQKIKEFQNIIDRTDFTFRFQPVVDLITMEPAYYEILSRFAKGETQEWIIFAEENGLAPRFDLAVLERTINHINFKAGGERTCFAMNISGQSIQDKDFFGKFMEQLAAHANLHKRLSFEITESAHIVDLGKVKDFLAILRKAGFKVALDDFGAGAASFEYLQTLPVDAVKIDGKYIRKMLSSPRDLAMVKNLARLCSDLGIDVVAEYVEEKKQLELVRGMGVKYGQGFYLGKPEASPQYQTPKD
ncbi:MAG: EAL domain-containing protein [Alphaproteobacteria bacterium]|nr:EAL domain-containing protein [Alphaproteobacteria bacterium]